MAGISDSSLDKIFNDSSIVSQEEVKVNDEKYWSQKINIEIIVSDADEKYSFMHFYRLFEIVLKEYTHDFIIVNRFNQQSGSEFPRNKYIFELSFDYRLELPPVIVIKFIRSLVQIIPYNEEADMLQPVLSMFIIYTKMNMLDPSDRAYDCFAYKNISELNNINQNTTLYLLSHSLIDHKINTIVDMFYRGNLNRKPGINYGKKYINNILTYLKENGSTR